MSVLVGDPRDPQIRIVPARPATPRQRIKGHISENSRCSGRATQDRRLKAGVEAAAGSSSRQIPALGSVGWTPDASPSALTNSIMTSISRKHDFEFDMLGTDGADKSKGSEGRRGQTGQGSRGRNGAKGYPSRSALRALACLGSVSTPPTGQSLCWSVRPGIEFRLVRSTIRVVAVQKEGEQRTCPGCILDHMCAFAI